jgi:hypothetical protein
MHTNSIIKFADDTTVVGLITNNDKTAYREVVRALGVWCQELTSSAATSDPGQQHQCNSLASIPLLAPGLEPGTLCTHQQLPPTKHLYPKAADLAGQGEQLLQGLRASDVTD